MSRYFDSIARAPRTMTERDQLRILRTTGEHVAGWRDHCIFSLAFGAGLREKEIVGLNVGDVYDADGKAKRRIVLRVFKRTRAKAIPPQDVFLSETLRAKLNRLYELKKRAGEPLLPDSPIFVSRLGKRLSRRQVRNMNAVWQRRAGLDTHYKFHTARHNACSAVYRAKRDIRMTQMFARHADIRSTVIYTHPSAEELAQVVETVIC